MDIRSHCPGNINSDDKHFLIMSFLCPNLAFANSLSEKSLYLHKLSRKKPLSPKRVSPECQPTFWISWISVNSKIFHNTVPLSPQITFDFCSLDESGKLSHGAPRRPAPPVGWVVPLVVACILEPSTARSHQQTPLNSQRPPPSSSDHHLHHHLQLHLHHHLHGLH